MSSPYGMARRRESRLRWSLLLWQLVGAAAAAESGAPCAPSRGAPAGLGASSSRLLWDCGCANRGERGGVRQAQGTSAVLTRCSSGAAAFLRLRGGAEDSFFEGYNALKSHNDFGNDGHIYQIEYALESVKRGLTVVAVKGDKCLAIAVERRAVQKLQLPESMRKIHQLDAHIVATAAGLAADALPIVDRARIEALTFRLNYEDCASVEYIARYIADVMLECSLDKEKRPYGCSMLVTGLDLLTGSLVVENPKPYPVPRIFVCDPSGAYKEWKAGAPRAMPSPRSCL